MRRTRPTVHHMRRREFISVALAGSHSFLTAGPSVDSEDLVAWGSVVSGLLLGLRLDVNAEPSALTVWFKNTTSIPEDLYVFNGDLPILQFVATDKEGRDYRLENRKLYIPCAGLCDSSPKVQRLERSTVFRIGLSQDDLLSVPAHGSYVTLAHMLDAGCSVRVVFENTEETLKQSRLTLKFPWFGRAVSGEVRK